MDIDLNLNNYSKEDLEQLFGVSPGYKVGDIEEKEKELAVKLFKFQVDSKIQSDIASFLKQARERLSYFLIPKAVDQFFYSAPSEFFQGKFNPIEKRIVTKIVNIDTLFRPQYDLTLSTDFMYNFPETMNNIASMRVASIEIPYVWYAFSADRHNNTFYLNDVLITIPDGNYTADQFTIMLNVLVPGSVTIDSITGRTTLVASSLKFNVYKLPLYQQAGWMMGFRKAEYTGTSTSESSYGSYDNYFFIEIDDFHNNFLTDAVISVTRTTITPTYLGNNIIARIPVTTGINETIVSNANDTVFRSREYFGPVNLERLHIRILNKFGEVIQLNSNDYSLVLELKQLYS